MVLKSHYFNCAADTLILSFLRLAEARIPPGVATIDFNTLHFVIAYGIASASGTLSLAGSQQI